MVWPHVTSMTSFPAVPSSPPHSFCLSYSNLLLFHKVARRASAPGPLHLPASFAWWALPTEIPRACILISLRFLLKCHFVRPFLAIICEISTLHFTLNFLVPLYFSDCIYFLVHFLLPFSLLPSPSTLKHRLHEGRIFVCFVHCNSLDT